MTRKKKTVSELLLLLMILFVGCTRKPGEEIHGFAKWILTQEDYLTFQDGEAVQEWTNEEQTQRRYQIQEEEALLEAEFVTDFLPETEKKGLNGFGALSEEVQGIIASYYEAKEKTFDIVPYLEAAYQDYRDSAEAEVRFQTHRVLREVMPIAENPCYVAFLTALTVPKREHYDGDNICIYEETFFDRETGEVIKLEDLFLPEDWVEVQKALSKLCAEDDMTVTSDELYDAIGNADVLIFQDYLEVWFPYGTWDRQEFDKGFGIKYDRLTELMQEWAVPAEEAEQGE